MVFWQWIVLASFCARSHEDSEQGFCLHLRETKVQNRMVGM